MKDVIINDLRDIQVFSKALNQLENNNQDIELATKAIIDDVKANGKQAVLKYTNKFDCPTQTTVYVSKEEFEDAENLVSTRFKEIIKKAKSNIRTFHKNQLPKAWNITTPTFELGQLVRPIEKIAVYVPGGKAAYPSSVLMNIIPAQIAGVKSIVIITPPGPDGKVNPNVLHAASSLGITDVLKVGGAQGVAAAAYGIEGLEPVDKIVGPGNAYVASAKKQVFGKVDIDMIAGPSEVCIFADENANPEFIAADLLSQAEHDEMARLFLVTTSQQLIDDAKSALKIQLSKSTRKEICTSAVENFSYFIKVADRDTGIKVCNAIAPEHLELLVENPKNMMNYINNAGSIFLGEYSPEPLGDYWAGANHTLPTSGTARYASPLGVYDFVKRPSYIYYSEEALKEVHEDISYFAEAEGLDCHSESIKIRFKEDTKEIKADEVC